MTYEEYNAVAKQFFKQYFDRAIKVPYTEEQARNAQQQMRDGYQSGMSPEQTAFGVGVTLGLITNSQ